MPLPKRRVPKDERERPKRKGRPVEGKSYRRLGGNRYRNTKQGSPRRGKVFRMGGDGAHVYKSGARIGGKDATPRRPKRRSDRQKRGRQERADPTAPLTGRGFRREVNAQTRLQFRPVMRELNREEEISRQHEENIGDWYNEEYLPTLTQAANRTSEAYQSAQQGTAQNANQIAESERQRVAEQLKRAKADAAKRGATVDPSTSETAMLGVQRNQEQGASMAGTIGAMGAAQQGYMAQQPVVARQQELQFRRSEADRRRDIQKRRSEVASDRGEFRRAVRGDLRESERRYGLERAAFDLEGYEAKINAKDKALRRRQSRAKSRREARRDRRDFRAGRSDERFDRDDTLADNRRADRREERQSGNDRREHRESYSSAVAVVRGLNPRKVRKNPDGVVAAIVQDEGVPALLARAAVQRVIHGRVAPKLARRIKKRYGVNVPSGSPRKVEVGPGGIPQPEIDRIADD